jgi:hypothetical protein
VSGTGSNDNGCDDFFGLSSVSWNSTAGAIYHIQVTGYEEDNAGAYSLQVTGVASNQTLVETASPGKAKQTADSPEPGTSYLTRVAASRRLCGRALHHGNRQHERGAFTKHEPGDTGVFR